MCAMSASKAFDALVNELLLSAFPANAPCPRRQQKRKLHSRAGLKGSKDSSSRCLHSRSRSRCHTKRPSCYARAGASQLPGSPWRPRSSRAMNPGPRRRPPRRTALRRQRPFAVRPNQPLQAVASSSGLVHP